MSGLVLVVPLAAYSMEDPWQVPAACRPAALLDSVSGEPPQLETHVAAYHDASFLTMVFTGRDDHVTATLLEHDAPLYREDVVEVFLAPRTPAEYFEIEVNPLGTIFDARIGSPHGTRESMTTDLGWTCRDLFAAVKRSDGELITVMRIPFASLGVEEPASGTSWRGNLFRIDRHPSRETEYQAWSPTLRKPADFHVTAAFGTLLFE